jgi:hypothetical protein
MAGKRVHAGEGGVENVYVETLVPEVRADIEDAQRDVGFANLKLLGIFEKEIAVGEEEITH